MPVKINAFAGLISIIRRTLDWYDKSSTAKKVYINVTFFLLSHIAVITILGDYVQSRESFHNSRLDSVTVYFVGKLGECNDSKSAVLMEVITKVQQQQQAQFEIELALKKADADIKNLKTTP